MKHLKLIINNKNKKRDIFFNKAELQLILNLYASVFFQSIVRRRRNLNTKYKSAPLDACPIILLNDI